MTILDYGPPWWALVLWGFAIYAVTRFLVKYIWKKLR